MAKYKKDHFKETTIENEIYFNAMQQCSIPMLHTQAKEAFHSKGEKDFE